MSFEENIQQWVAIDNQIKRYNSEVKELRSKRNHLSNSIHSYVNENNLSSAVINISDGALKFQDVKVTAPLTLKFIENCLLECIENETNVEEIMKYIKSKRPIKYNPDIKRSYNK
tara:strand:+ start:255 stop:599 length:345 start_codon:yes stop_codon:yes gene_type:complete